MKKVMVIAVFLMLVSLVPVLSSAEGIVSSELTGVRIAADGRGMAYFADVIGNTPPSCASGYRYQLSFDTNNAAGKAIHATLLTALAAGKSVYAKGSGTCTTYTVVENWEWGQVLD